MNKAGQAYQSAVLGMPSPTYWLQKSEAECFRQLSAVEVLLGREDGRTAGLGIAL